MTDNDRRDLRDYAWKYFALHADQRLRTFNFYLLIVAVIVGGVLAYLKDARSPAYAAPAGFLLAALSYLFCRLDRRAQEFIKHSEGVLKAVERDILADQVPEDLRLFEGEDKKTKDLRQKHGMPGWNPVSWVTGHFGYYACLKAAFIIFGLLGVCIGVLAFFLPGSSPPASPPPAQQNFYIGGAPGSPPPTTKP
jgi:hypothetical protein